ncbi:DUF4232 domain-containing protein [Streptomyces minutiscleroticus]|uniref:DUF4232 domain-containing protein n=1 Tax=Streptomyces minutiscleroticus TaxID=68238 RepID=A0A918NZV7_9ACTN|nr:DUF4232 domain-containing protein [Streptomyces minutiscleroticus]GGY08677.1 hypothetical protein GCM10010358_72090 [Streptomyces minutiscleroticus]
MTTYRNTTDWTPRNRTSHRLDRTALAAAAVVALGLAGAGTAQAADAHGTSAAKTAPACSPAAFKTLFGRPLAGGMNHQGVFIKLRNLSGSTCALRGYPGLALENSAHKTLPSHTHRGDTWYATSPGEKNLILKDGESAEAIVSWTHANTGTSDAVRASYLRVALPGAARYTTLAFPQWVDHGDLRTTALAKHIDVAG